MVNSGGKPKGTIDTKTKYRLDQLTAFIDENNRVPTVEEVKSILSIENTNTARNYLQLLKKAMPEPSTLLGEIQEKLLANIKKRLDDSENLMNDSDMIKLLEFMFPKKSESHQTVEVEKVIGADDAVELEQYAKLFGDAEKPLTEAL